MQPNLEDKKDLINEDVYINKHHSVLHTVVRGLIFKLGDYNKANPRLADKATVLRAIDEYDLKNANNLCGKLLNSWGFVD